MDTNTKAELYDDMKQVQLQVVYPTKNGTLSRQIPTFWLMNDVNTCRTIIQSMFHGATSVHGTIMDSDFNIYNV
jgi:hypothetical protein